jgi:hypothetical protein
MRMRILSRMAGFAPKKYLRASRCVLRRSYADRGGPCGRCDHKGSDDFHARGLPKPSRLSWAAGPSSNIQCRQAWLIQGGSALLVDTAGIVIAFARKRRRIHSSASPTLRSASINCARVPRSSKNLMLSLGLRRSASATAVFASSISPLSTCAAAIFR